MKIIPNFITVKQKEWAGVSTMYKDCECNLEHLKASGDHRIEITVDPSLATWKNRVRSAKLVLTYAYLPSNLDGILVPYYSTEIKNFKLFIDVTRPLKMSRNPFTVSIFTNGSSEIFCKTGDSAPYMDVVPTMMMPSQANVSIFDKVDGNIDLDSGKLSTVTQIISPDSSLHGVGVNLVSSPSGLELNLNETFDGTEYTTADGRDQIVTKRFFYKKDGKKILVAEENVEINGDGSFTATVDGKDYEAFREEIISGDIKVSTAPKNVKNVALYETRSDELKQVQEQLKKYSAFADNLVLWREGVDADNEKTVVSTDYSINLNSPNLEKIINDVEKTEDDRAYISSVNEFEQLKNICLQLKLVNKCHVEPESQNILVNYKTEKSYYANDMKCDEIQLQQSIYESQERLKYYLNNYAFPEDTPGVYVFSDNVAPIDLSQFNMIEDDEEYPYKENETASDPENSTSDSATAPTSMPISGRTFNSELRTRNLYAVLLKSVKDSRQDQTDVLTAQLDFYKTFTQKYLEELKTVFKEYFMLKSKETELLKNTPVNFISLGSEFKGFNEDGELILFFKNQDCYVSVNRDKKGKILSLTDENGNAVLFKYDVDGKLAYVTDVRGRIVSITYPQDRQTSILYPDGQTLDIFLTEITVGDTTEKAVVSVGTNGKTAIMNYTDGLVKLITRWDNASNQSETFSVAKDGQVIRITDFDKTLTKYTVEDGAIIQKAVSKGDYTIEKVKTTFNVTVDEDLSWSKVQHYATKSSLYQIENALTFAVDTNGNPTDNYIKEEFDDFDKIIYKEEKFDGKVTKTDYVYDEDDLLIKEVAVYERVKNGSVVETYTGVVEYSYDQNKTLVKKVSYVVGEEKTNGKSIEEWIYDKNGILIKSFTYNSLDSSSKFYTERIYDGKTHLADLDQLGDSKTEFEYVDKSALVKTQRFANGSKFSFGYDCADRLTAITQSTEEGEENSTNRIYQNGLLKKLVSGNTVVEYDYTGKNQLSSVTVDGNTTNYTYSADGLQVTEKDCDGNETVTQKDVLGNVLSITKNGKTIETNTYEKGLLKTSVKDGISRSYYYDGNQRPTGYYSADGKGVLYTYGANNDLLTSVSGGGKNYTCSYTTGSNKKLQSVLSDNTYTNYYNYDVLGRVASRSLNYQASTIDKVEISYLKKGDHATTVPSSLRFWNKPTLGFKDKLNYVYDNLGNITKIYENGKLLAKYAYDGVNRLIREDNVKFGESYFFAYDKTGNITSKRTCPLTFEKTEKIHAFSSEDIFSYKGDKLVAKNGVLCSYSKGKPTTYLGKAMEFKEKGLISSYNGISFTYDDYGKRKTKGNLAYTYTHDGDLETITDGTSTITFLNNHTNQPLGFKIGDAKYFYRRNLQGDIIAILDTSANVVVQYVYDGWGNHKVLDANGFTVTDQTHVGNVNPIRYRGYYYDVETGLYYLKSRYYDPTIGRFISPDSVDFLNPDTINGLNLYAYCGNNPIMNVDPSGHFAITTTIGLFVAAYIVMALLSITTYIESETHIIQNGLNLLGNAIVDFGEYILTGIENLFGNTNISNSNIVFTSEARVYEYENIYYYKRKKVAPRIKSKSKKKAREKAFLKGGKMQPIHHPNGKHGSHYHPNDPRFSHWHYYYLWLFLFGYEE